MIHVLTTIVKNIKRNAKICPNYFREITYNFNYMTYFIVM